MSKAIKNSLTSVAVMAVIAFASVALLSVANRFLVYVPKLDEATARLINTICPSGVDDATAFSGDYVRLLTDDDLASAGFDRAAFNADSGSPKNQLYAVYRAAKGDNAGCYIFEAMGKGYSDRDIVMLTAFDATGAIMGVVAKSQQEDSGFEQVFDADYFAKFTAFAVGRTEFTAQEVTAATGASTTHSVRGLTDAVTLSCLAAQQVLPLDEALAAIGIEEEETAV